MAFLVIKLARNRAILEIIYSDEVLAEITIRLLRSGRCLSTLRHASRETILLRCARCAETNPSGNFCRKVETHICRILRRRFEECTFHEYPDHRERCAQVKQDFEEAELNLFIKYGDMGIKTSAQMTLMKQKHRLIFERRKREGYVANYPIIERRNDLFDKPSSENIRG